MLTPRRRWLLLTAAALVLVLPAFRANAIAAASTNDLFHQARTLGYLVPHHHAYERKKARLTRRFEARSQLARPASSPVTPDLPRSWRGVEPGFDMAPPDPTSAVGTKRFIELANGSYGIYDKAEDAPLAQGTLSRLVGGGTDVFDPQIIWDDTTGRFYYAAMDHRQPRRGAVDLVFGFSRSPFPDSADRGDWCKYSFSQRLLPDFPKLGDSKRFALIGVNKFGGSGGDYHYAHSDLIALTKPGRHSTRCPKRSQLNYTDKQIDRSAFTPVPANEIDTGSTGWAVARSRPLLKPGSKLYVFKITTRRGGTAQIHTSPTAVEVPQYEIAPEAPQGPLDTSDGRNTQAVAARDPAHDNKLALWTQHTVRGGAGAEVRWYEINPQGHSLLQSGVASDPNLFEFNGAISPDRQVRGKTRSGGDAMVLNYNTSSDQAAPDIRMVSKTPSEPQSNPLIVAAGKQPLSGLDCRHTDPCRWGDYAAATPDPSTAGRIWQTSEYVAPGPNRYGFASTWNFVADLP
jgi:hypothetical protein